jgi:hypothetical protein
VPVLEGFRAFLRQEKLRPELGRLVEEIESRAPRPSDTHPPLRERLAAIDRNGRALAASHHESPGCLDLLGGEAKAEALFYSRATNGKLTEVGWTAVAKEVLVPAQVKRFDNGPLALERVAPTALPALLADWPSLARALAGGVPSFLSPAAERARVRRLLEEWLSAALMIRGFEPLLVPGASLILRRGEETLEPEALVQELDEGRISRDEYERRARDWEAGSEQDAG